MGEADGVLTAEELAQMRVKVEDAWAMVARLCLPRNDPAHREWLMRIPARMGHDPDLVIGEALGAADALLAHADALAIENTRLRAALAPVADDYPTATFRELWRVLKELRAATGEEGQA